MQVWFRSTFTVCSWDLWECGWGGKKGTNLANEKSEVSQELLLMFSWRLYDEWLTSWPLRPPFFFVMRHFCICRVIQKLHDQHQHGEHMDKNNNARLAWMDPFININQCTGPTGEVLDFSIAFFARNVITITKWHTSEDYVEPEVVLPAQVVEQENGLKKCAT